MAPLRIQHVAPAQRTEDARLRGGEAGVFLLAETLVLPSPYSGETRRINATRRFQRLDRSLSLLLTTKRADDGVHSLSESHELRLVATRLATFRMRTGREANPCLGKTRKEATDVYVLWMWRAS